MLEQNYYLLEIPLVGSKIGESLLQKYFSLISGVYGPPDHTGKIMVSGTKATVIK